MDCKNLHWYVISVTSGKEIKTRDWLLENKERFCVDDTILDKIFLPVQKKIVVKDGKKIGRIIDVEFDIVFILAVLIFEFGVDFRNVIGFNSGIQDCKLFRCLFVDQVILFDN